MVWSIWSILSTRSISEYLRRYPGVNVRLREAKMYLLMAAAIKLPPNRWQYEGKSVPPPPSVIRGGVRVMING
jgi:hypothetical protein